MKTNSFWKSLTVLCFFLSLPLSFLWAKGEKLNDSALEWKKLYTKENITVYEWLKQEGSIVAFRATGIINIKPAEIVTLLKDFKGSTKWTPNVGEKWTVKQPSANEIIAYTHNLAPWPVTDRDMVVYSELKLDPDQPQLLVNSYSVDDHSVPPHPKRIRLIITKSRFTIKPVSEGSYVEFDVYMDPKGWVPRWLMSFVQKDYPYDFLKNMENYGKKNPAFPDADALVLLKSMKGEEVNQKQNSQTIPVKK